jgi:hypothetical protein
MTRNSENTDTLWVCVDCYFAHHGAEDDPSHTPDCEPLNLVPESADVTSGMFWEQHECLPDTEWDDVPADHECECEQRSFSSSRCQGCGSHLGGAREALTVWYADNS